MALLRFLPASPKLPVLLRLCHVLLFIVCSDLAQGSLSLTFPYNPVNGGNNYPVSWSGGNGGYPLNLTLLQISPKNVWQLGNMSGSDFSTVWEVQPPTPLETGGDYYYLQLVQGTETAFSPDFEIKPSVTTTTATATTIVTASSSKSPRISSSTQPAEPITPTSGPVITPPPSVTQIPTTTPHSPLSTGSKAAIGVLVPLAALSLVASGIWFLARRRQRRTENTVETGVGDENDDDSGRDMPARVNMQQLPMSRVTEKKRLRRK